MEIKWAIVYDDMRVVRGCGEEEFKSAPSDGVQFVVWDSGQIFFDHDYYWYMDELYDQTNDIGPLMRKLGVKCGRTVNNETFEKARVLAIELLGEMNGS